MQYLFNRCPSCNGRLVITECRCNECGLQMRSEFQPNRFSELSQDELNFIGVFLNARGNLSEVERVLGISYPTIRNKLDEINNTLGNTGNVVASPPGNSKATTGDRMTDEEVFRKGILHKVANGELSAEEAVAILDMDVEERE